MSLSLKVIDQSGRGTFKAAQHSGCTMGIAECFLPDLHCELGAKSECTVLKNLQCVPVKKQRMYVWDQKKCGF